ncbi:MAG: hypothetical protein ACK5LR_09485, partial [Mangrovibacterium sp.]
MYGNSESLAYAPWPVADESLLVEDSFEYPVSFNGKVRFKMAFAIDADKSAIEQAVLASEEAQRWMDGKAAKKIIVVPKKIINVVV